MPSSQNSDEKSAAFAQKMTDVLNHAALNASMALGYRSGLFECLDDMAAPCTALQLAEHANLSARYVREWLGVMVTGGVIELRVSEEGEELFFLPKEHADFLTRRAGSNNLGVYTQEIPLLTQCAMEEVLQSFHTGDGVPYSRYPRFQEFMGQLADAKHRQTLVDIFLPSVRDGEIVRLLNQGARVCDMGCAQGLALVLMAEAFPNSDFTGIDIDESALVAARNKAREMNLNNVRFLNRDAAARDKAMAFTGVFDYVTAFDAIHDQTRPLEAMQGAHAMLKPGGVFSMVDIAASSAMAENRAHAMAPFLYTVSLLHCLPVGLVNNGAGLGMMWGRELAQDMLVQAGFSRVEVTPIPHDAFNLHFCCIK